MEPITVKRKQIEIIEQLGDNSFVGIFKNKKCFVKKFNDEASFDIYLDKVKKINGSGINNPKIYLIDKRNYVILSEYIDGRYVLDLLLEKDLDEELYNLLFQQFWYAKADRVNLDYHPDKWMYSNGKVYYLTYEFNPYTNKDDFLKNDLKLWFISKEFIEYAKSLEKVVDESRLPNEYELNRKMTLMSLKYYR